MMFEFAAGAATDVGQIREVNQDSHFVAEGLAIVADGMGGHRGGEVASEIAVTTLRTAFDAASMISLTAGVGEANTEIIAQASLDPALHGMGTTICAVAVLSDGDEEPERLGIVNVGDSRVYVFRNGQLEQITVDHSLVEALVREGRLTPEEAEVHPQRNILTRALGVAESVEVDEFDLAPSIGDRYLLCSDGLFNEVTEERISELLGTNPDPAVAAARLVDEANAGGGRDNITTVVVDVVEFDPDREPRPDDRPTTEVPVVGNVSAPGADDEPSLDTPIAPDTPTPRRRWWPFG